MGVEVYPVATGDVSFPDTKFDAFGRFRMSNPYTVFDTKLVYDKQNLFWDEELISGGGISSSHSTDTASVTLTSTLNTAGEFARQTFQSFNYQAGKSQLIYMTGNMRKSGGGVGVETCMGQYNDDNGIFLKYDAGVPTAVIRSNVTGTPADTEVVQSAWDDPLDGTGASGITIDWTNEIILTIDYGWLGSANVRMGVITSIGLVYFHTFAHANAYDGVYMSTPNLPLRYEMITQATSAASTMGITCATVITEGGSEEIGFVCGFSTNGTAINANAANTAYVVCGTRLKAAAIGSTVHIEAISTMTTTNDDYEWLLLMNPTLANAATFTDQAEGALQIAVGEASSPSLTSVTAVGTILQSGYGAGGTAESELVHNTLHIGAKIDGTRDEVYLCVRSLSSNAKVHGSITVRELT